MRLVCGPKGAAGNPLAGQGQAVYPLGYVGSAGTLERKSLDEILDISKAPGDLISMDLGFPVPTNLTPVLLEFKRNNVVQVSAPATAEEAPQPIAFGMPASAAAPNESSAPAPGQPGVQAASGPPAQTAPAPSSGSKGKNRSGKQRKGLSDISKSVTGPQVPEN
jgi:hypothetical protein